MIKSLPTNSLLPRGEGQSPDEDLNLLDFREPLREKGQATHWAMIFSLIALHGGLLAYLVGFARIADPSSTETAPRVIPVEIASSGRHQALPKEDLEIRHQPPIALSAQTLPDAAAVERVPRSTFPVITRSVKLAQARIGVLPEDGGRVDEMPPQSASDLAVEAQKKETAQPVEQEQASPEPFKGPIEQESEQTQSAPKPAEPVLTLVEPLPEDRFLPDASQKTETRLPEIRQRASASTKPADESGESQPDSVEWLQAREVTAESAPIDAPQEKAQLAVTENASPAPSISPGAETRGPTDMAAKRSNEPGLVSAPLKSPMPSDRATDGAREFRAGEPPISPQLQEAADRYGQILASQEDTRWPEDVGKADADATGQTASVKAETDAGSYKPEPAIMSGGQETADSLPIEAPLPERRTVYAHEIASHEARDRRASKPEKTASTKPRNSRRQLLDDYRSQVRNHLASYRPPGGFGADMLVVGFTLTRSGKVASARILKSRGIYHLEQGTLNAVHRAAPFPRPPGNLSGARFHFAIPFRFE